MKPDLPGYVLVDAASCSCTCDGAAVVVQCKRLEEGLRHGVRPCGDLNVLRLSGYVASSVGYYFGAVVGQVH